MKKKQKARQGRNVAVLPADNDSVARRVESALERGEVDIACQLLSQARQLQGSIDPAVAARAFTAQAYGRWDRPARALESLERAAQWTPNQAEIRRLRGSLLRRLGRLKLASAELDQARRLAPGDRQIAFESLLTRLAAGDSGADLAGLVAALDAQAARRANSLLAVLRGDLPAAVAAMAPSADPLDKLVHAVLLLGQSQAVRAIPSLEMVAAQEEQPDLVRAVACFYLGVARLQRRELAAAVEAFGKSRSLGMAEDQLRSYLSWAYQQLATDAVLGEDLSAAAQWFGRLNELGGPEALTARDNAVHAFRLVGQQAAQKEDYAGAVSAWSEALALSPRDAPLRQNLAIALERADRGVEAIPHWQELVRLIPRTAEKAARRRPDERSGEEEELNAHIRAVAHQHLADLYLEEGEGERAIDQLERASRLLPSNVDIHRDLARLLADEGQTGKAIPHYEQVVADGSGTAQDHLELGVAYMSLDNQRSGIEHLEKSLSLEPGSPLTRGLVSKALAQIVIRSPEAATALDDAKRAMDLMPAGGPIVPITAYGAAQLARGDRKGADKTFKRAIKQARDKTGATIDIGNAYWRAGEEEAAREAWAKAMGKAKGNPCLYAPLAVVWAQAGDKQRCEECLDASLDHSEDEAVQAMERIGRSSEQQPLLREVLRDLVASSDDSFQQVYLAQGLLYAGDAQAARLLVRRLAREAVETDDMALINGILDLDVKYNYKIIDGKTAGALRDWLAVHEDLIVEGW